MDTQTPRYNAYMPSAGIASFLRSPICEGFSKVEADVAILGIPYDCGVGYRPCTRFGPREIRNQSTRYASWGTGNAAEGQTSLLATTLIIEFLGAIFAARGR